MEFVVRLPQWSEHAHREGFERIAKAAEQYGFDGVWRGDHITYPDGTAEESQWSISTTCYDMFTVLSFISGVTEDLRLGTNVCVVPYRHPVTLAKLVLSLDNLSNGRVEFGAAPGWHESEFEVLEVPFEERGMRTDEFLELFDRVQSEPEFAFDGPCHSFHRTGFYPRPVQSDIPVWIGGRSGASIRRVGQYGDGWTDTSTPAQVRKHRSRLLEAWNDFDRDGEPRVAASQQTYVGTDPPNSFDPNSPMVGSPEQIAEDIEEYSDAGTTRLDLKQEGLPVGERVEQLRRFREEVVTAL